MLHDANMLNIFLKSYVSLIGIRRASASTTPAASCFSSHSQIVNTRHPSACKAASARRSRSTVPANFSVQKSRLDAGVVAKRHPGCRCQ